MGTHRQTQGSSAQPAAARGRALVYHALAEALAGPIPGIGSLLLDAVTAGARALGSAACQKAVLALAEFPMPCIEALEDSYAYLITGSGQQQPVVLYESLHRQGRLAGQLTWEIERHYQALGLALVDGELPDHASVELAFLGHLAAVEAEARTAGDNRLVTRLRAEQRAFLRTHAGAWLPDVGVAMAAAAERSFYTIVGRMLSGFLSEELVGRKLNGQTGARLPTLKEPAACTLCGLCVSSCLLGALRVIESASQTTLAMNVEQCIGCNRCVRTCPEEALLLSSGAANVTGCLVMRDSPRAACLHCGRPTVSLAELDAVFARLRPDPTMQQHLSLCVECKS